MEVRIFNYLATQISPHNLGRGGLLADFRENMVHNVMHGDFVEPHSNSRKIRILFSQLSSRDADRRLDFDRQSTYLRENLGDEFSIQTAKLWEMDLGQQVELVQTTDIFVSTCGGGSLTATFLSKGASFFVYYNTTGSYDFLNAEKARANGLKGRELMKVSLNHEPARLDWDLLNNAGYLSVHWLPVDTMNEIGDLDLLLRLVEHEVVAKRLIR